MKPIKFKEHTSILNKPVNMTDEQCVPLPVWNVDSQTCVSCWQGSWTERLRFLITGKIYLGVMSGLSQPPVWLSVSNPFHFYDLC